jgi:hypothetical protein
LERQVGTNAPPERNREAKVENYETTNVMDTIIKGSRRQPPGSGEETET